MSANSLTAERASLTDANPPHMEPHRSASRSAVIPAQSEPPGSREPDGARPEGRGKEQRGHRIYVSAQHDRPRIKRVVDQNIHIEGRPSHAGANVEEVRRGIRTLGGVVARRRGVLRVKRAW